MSLDRLERRLPEVLTELSLPRMPDYVDDLLGRTERMSQRPGWTYLERWIPLSTFTATLSRGGRLPLRPLIAVALVIALIVAAVALYVGTQKRPPLFGPAANGLIVTSSNGSIVTIDPATGARSTLIGGDTLCCVSMSPDGQRIGYLDIRFNGADPTALRVASIGGQVIAEQPAEFLHGLGWGEWSPRSDRIIGISSLGVTMFDVATRKTTVLGIEVPYPIKKISWIGTSDDLLISARPDPKDAGAESVPLHVYRWKAATGTTTEIAVLQNAVEAPVLSPDGSKLAYFIWGAEPRLQGRVHVFDLAMETDTAITPEDEASNADPHSVEDVVWSPDSLSIASYWLWTSYDQIGIVSVNGGEPVFVGPKEPQGFGPNSKIRFSPDGKTLLIQYGGKDTTLLVPLAGGEARSLSWALSEDIDWQRRAP